MVKFAAIALTSVLGVAGMASAAPAMADSFVTVRYGAGPYAYARGPLYWHRDFYRHDFDRDHYRYRGHFDHFRR
jgi:hypothetical protein